MDLGLHLIVLTDIGGPGNWNFALRLCAREKVLK